MAVTTIPFERAMREVPRVRHAVRDELTSQGAPALLVEAAALVTSELATSAIVRCRGHLALQVGWRAADRAVEIEVEGEPWPPGVIALLVDDPLATGGLGWKLARRWCSRLDVEVGASRWVARATVDGGAG